MGSFAYSPSNVWPTMIQHEEQLWCSGTQGSKLHSVAQILKVLSVCVLGMPAAMSPCTSTGWTVSGNHGWRHNTPRTQNVYCTCRARTERWCLSSSITARSGLVRVFFFEVQPYLQQVSDAGQLLTDCGLKLTSVDVDNIVMKYKSSWDLIQHLRVFIQLNWCKSPTDYRCQAKAMLAFIVIGHWIWPQQLQ